jgi:hypothetical protein
MQPSCQSQPPLLEGTIDGTCNGSIADHRAHQWYSGSCHPLNPTQANFMLSQGRGHQQLHPSQRPPAGQVLSCSTPPESYHSHSPLPPQPPPQPRPQPRPQAHTVIGSLEGIWTKSVVRRRARLTLNQSNETNASISNTRYHSTYSKPSI